MFLFGKYISILFDLLFLRPLSAQYFSSIMATSFSGGRSRSTRREPPTIGTQQISFITCDCESSAPFCYLQSRARTHAALVIDFYELFGNPTTKLIEPSGSFKSVSNKCFGCVEVFGMVLSAVGTNVSVNLQIGSVAFHIICV